MREPNSHPHRPGGTAGRAVGKLADFPQIGRRVPEAEDAPEDIRELIFRDYRILYLAQLDDDTVHILAVIHVTCRLSRIARETNSGPLSQRR